MTGTQLKVAAVVKPSRVLPDNAGKTAGGADSDRVVFFRRLCCRSFGETQGESDANAGGEFARERSWI
jgi:hypothetical protein